MCSELRARTLCLTAGILFVLTTLLAACQGSAAQAMDQPSRISRVKNGLVGLMPIGIPNRWNKMSLATRMAYYEIPGVNIACPETRHGKVIMTH